MSIDFPRAWQIARSVPKDKHDPRCSFRITNGGLLCDCHIVNDHPEMKDSILHGMVDE